MNIWSRVETDDPYTARGREKMYYFHNKDSGESQVLNGLRRQRVGTGWGSSPWEVELGRGCCPLGVNPPLTPKKGDPGFLIRFPRRWAEREVGEMRLKSCQQTPKNGARLFTTALKKAVTEMRAKDTMKTHSITVNTVHWLVEMEKIWHLLAQI